MIFADQLDSLKQYAAVRNATADIVRDQFLSDVGLDEDGGKSYDLGNRTVIARLQADLGFLIELPGGKTAKSLPKKGADAQKYAVAEADFSEMKKYAGKIVKNRTEALFSDFLSGRARDAEDWRAAYLRNPLLRTVASRVVWRQDSSTFILKDGQPINSSGQAYSIGRKPIMPAHPMEMQPQELSAWQKYLTSHTIEQPFVQMWEPVIAAESVHEDRYKGRTILYRCFLNQQRHGFTVDDKDFYDQINIYTRGCYAKIKRIDWEYHCIEPDHRFEVEQLHFSRYTRQVNHIVSLLDSWAE